MISDIVVSVILVGVGLFIIGSGFLSGLDRNLVAPAGEGQTRRMVDGCFLMLVGFATIVFGGYLLISVVERAFNAK